MARPEITSYWRGVWLAVGRSGRMLDEIMDAAGYSYMEIRIVEDDLLHVRPAQVREIPRKKLRLRAIREKRAA